MQFIRNIIFIVALGPIKQVSLNLEKAPIKLTLPGFYDNIKKNIIHSDIKGLNETASYYFSKEGKLIRPMLNILFYKLLDPREKNLQHQLDWASVIEILHVASLVHDDILDDSQYRRGIPTCHEVYGKREATFSGNYLIGRAGRKIAEFNDIRLFQIYGNIMDNLTNGEYLQALKQKSFNDFNQSMQNYMIKTFYKTGALISNSLQGVCELQKSPHAAKSYSIGLHLGILGLAFQIIDDILDYTSTAQELGKSNFSDLKNGIVTAPVLFEYQITEHKKLFDQVLKENNVGMIDKVNQIVLNGQGLQMAKDLAYNHAAEAIRLLDSINPVYDDLKSLILQILERKK